MKFELGAGMRCDLELLVERRMLIQASSGGGKSRTLRRICEQTHGKVQQIIIDPEGELVSLREKFDYVVAAGPGADGDTQAHPRSAALLAERVMELGVSLIADLYELKPPQRVEFVRRFLEALMNLPKRLWHPVLLPIDEVQIFAPEGAKSESVGAVIDVATRGRKRGLSLIAATQRLSMLDKNVAATLHNKLIGFTSLDADLKRAAFELGFDKQQMLGLRELPAMRFWGFGPALTRAPTLVEIGPHITTHPKPGAKIAAPVPPPTAKVKAMLPKLADLPAEAEQRQKSVDELKHDLATARATITRLERAAPTRVETKVETKIEQVKVAVVKDAQLKRLEHLATQLSEALNPGDWLKHVVLPQLAPLVRGFVAAVAAVKQPPPPRGAVARVSVTVPVRGDAKRSYAPTVDPVEVAPKEMPTEAAALASAQRKLLNALAFLDKVGYTTPTRTQVALFAGLAPSAGHTDNMFGRLRSVGLITYPKDGLAMLTIGGRALADPGDVPQTAEEMQQWLLGRVASAQRKLLKVLIEVYPKELDRSEVAERAGLAPHAGHTDNMFGKLRSMGVIDYPTKGTAVALPVLFLEGAA